MKLAKLSALLVVALAMTLGATGCKKRPGMTTPLPNRPYSGNIGGENPIPPGEQLGGGGEVTGEPGGGPLPTNWKPEDMIQDRSKFSTDTVYFAFDSSAVRSGEEGKVDAVASALQGDPSLYLLIEGHCDERGTEEYNRALGERRALALREALVSKGISANRISTISYGEDKPAVQGHNEAAWSKNRRGVFVACTPK